MKKRNRPIIQKSLSVVLASLQGHNLEIELKNDKKVLGMIETVGHGMDIQLRDVKIESEVDESELSESMLILGENIRFIHIPPTIQITSHLSKYMQQVDKRSFKKPKIVDRPKSSSSSSSSTTMLFQDVIIMPTPNKDVNCEDLT